MSWAALIGAIPELVGLARDIIASGKDPKVEVRRMRNDPDAAWRAVRDAWREEHARKFGSSGSN